MKQIRTTSTVLLDAQTNKRGIAVIRLEEFKFLGNTSIVMVGYYEQIEVVGAQVGEPKYQLVQLPVKDAVGGKMHMKRVTLLKAQIDTLFTAVDSSVLKTGSFTEQMDDVLTAATLIKVVMDQNYSKVDENNVLTLLGPEDWEIVTEQDLVEA